MKIQCACGAKYSFDVTPDMARRPVQFSCPGCGVNLSGAIHELVLKEFGPAQVPSAPAVPHPALLPGGDAIPAATAAPVAAAPPAPASAHPTRIVLPQKPPTTVQAAAPVAPAAPRPAEE